MSAVSRTDIVGDGAFSRLVILFVLATGAIFIPKNLAELLSLINKKSHYDHSYKEKKAQNHVVVCGQFDTIALRSFLKEFFCLDHGSSTVNTHVVILHPSEPSEDLQQILDDPMYANRVQYVRGSTADTRKLIKVRAKDAKACFIFSSKFASGHAVEGDAETVMRALALKKYKPDLQLHVQVILPEHKSHFDYLADTMVCVGELKLGLLAQNCRCPGFATLMYILTTSITTESCKKLVEGVRDDVEYKWVHEYLQGANQEIYPTKLSNEFAGLKFTEAAALVYRTFGAVLIGLGVPNMQFEVKQRKREKFDRLRELYTYTEEEQKKFFASIHVTPTDYDLFLNPGEYMLQGGEIAFVIASQIAVTKIISNFSPADMMKAQATTLHKDENGIFAFLKRALLPKNVAKPTESFSAAPSVSELADAMEVEPPLEASIAESMSSSVQNSVSELIVATSGSESVQDLLRNQNQNEDTSAASTNSGGAAKEKQSKLVLGKKPAGQTELMPTDIFADDGVSEGSPHSKVHVPVDHQTSGDPGIMSRVLQAAMGYSGLPELHGTRMRAMTMDSQASSLETGDIPYQGLIDGNKRFVSQLPAMVRKHILICDYSPFFPVGLEYFISPLRSVHLRGSHEDSYAAPIVILSPAEPSESQKRMLMRFEDVYVVQGTPLARKDLRRAGVQRCSKAVVMANTEQSTESPERTADASSLLVVLNIEALAEEDDIFIVTEFIHSENMQFVGDMENIIESEVDNVYGKTLMHPSFMSGHVFSQSMLDTVLCQNYYK